MFALALRTIKDRRIFTGAYTLAGILLMWMYTAIFPSFKEGSENYEQLLEGMPDELIAILGITNLNLESFGGFLAIEQFPLMWIIIAIFMLAALGGASIAAEIEKGTIELLISQPISRVKIFFAKYAAGIGALLLFALFSIFSVMPFAYLHGVEYSLSSFSSLFVISFLFGWTIFSMAVMFSAVFSERGRVYMATGGIMVAMYIANILSVLVDGADWVKYLSFFHYFDHKSALIDGELVMLSVFIFGFAIIAFTVAGIAIFKKRDIGI